MPIVEIDQIGKLKNFQLPPSDEVCFFGSQTVEGSTLPKGEGETEGGGGLVRVWHAHIATCNRILDSLGFWIPHCGLQIPGTGFQSLSVELGFWIPIISGIPDSLSCIPDSKTQDFRFHKPNCPDSGFPYMGWDKINLQDCGNEVCSLAIFVCKPKFLTCSRCSDWWGQCKETWLARYNSEGVQWSAKKKVGMN